LFVSTVVDFRLLKLLSAADHSVVASFRRKLGLLIQLKWSLY